MVKKVTPRVNRWALPMVRIETRDLVKVLEECAGTSSVRSTNGMYEFESIEDIRENSSLLAGKPTFQIGDAKISLSNNTYDHVVACYVRDTIDNDTQVFADKARMLLSPYKTYIHRQSFQFCAAIVGAGLLTGAWSLFATPKPILSVSPFWQTPIIFFGTAQIFGWALKMALPRDPVYYAPSQGFWDRNKDTIIVGTIMAVVGSLITLVLQRVLTVAP